MIQKPDPAPELGGYCAAAAGHPFHGPYHRDSHGSFAAWIEAHHPRPKEEWVKLFKKTFRFTGGEITGEFLMSIGYLPGAHEPGCPVYSRILDLDPAWARAGATAP